VARLQDKRRIITGAASAFRATLYCAFPAAAARDLTADIDDVSAGGAASGHPGAIRRGVDPEAAVLGTARTLDRGSRR
jgi:hypothetical protein